MNFPFGARMGTWAGFVAFQVAAWVFLTILTVVGGSPVPASAILIGAVFLIIDGLLDIWHLTKGAR